MSACGPTLLDAVTHAVATGNAVAAYVYARMALRVVLDAEAGPPRRWPRAYSV